MIQKGDKRRRKWGETKGDDGFKGRQSQYWMVVSIQTSVSGSIYQFLQIYACFDCVVINHKKERDCKENGLFKPLFCDFVD